MFASPASVPRVVLEDRLNFDVASSHRRKSYLPTPPKEFNTSRKRPAAHAQGKCQKKAKTRISMIDEETDEEDPTLFEESEDEPLVLSSPARRRTVFQTHSLFTSSSANARIGLDVSTRPILQSFVSSLKTDVYTCQSMHTGTFLTPPYACAYSHAARSGSLPLLAISTEEGTVQIINTSKRDPWDPEPVRNVLQPHSNGIFDVKWDRTDTHIVTCSGDHSLRITSVERNVVTHVFHSHTSTVKTVSYDPNHDSLLASGGRDGKICLWDLRISTSSSAEGIRVLEPVIAIHSAHEDPAKPRIRRDKKCVPVPRTVTGLIYPESEPFGIVSSGAFDGILRFWDLRKPETPRKSRSTQAKPPTALYSTPADPTVLNGSKRSRGIISLAQGTGPTAGLVFALGQDSRIHTYAMPALIAQSTNFSDVTMQAASFYLGLSLSPCGSWLACTASNPKSSTFLFDVKKAGMVGAAVGAQRAVELPGQREEVGALDWADGSLATCADDGTIRVWRPDVETYQRCVECPGDSQRDWCWSSRVM